MSDIVDILVETIVVKTLEIIALKKSLSMANLMIEKMLRSDTVINDNFVRANKERFDIIRKGLK